jgi:methionyl-tRNA formyltransferase
VEGEPGELVGDVVATGAGGLRLRVVQPEGRAAMAAADWARGARVAAGERLGR